MSRFFEELDYQPTAIGPISLRRRRELRLNVDVLEIMLGDEHLMSDLFTTSEIALAKYGLDAVDKDGQFSRRSSPTSAGRASCSQARPVTMLPPAYI